ncbi:DNA-binding Lrp family transcriptional regulator [Paenibacillus phyllosphaerae]|uniref:DNA-binding Lrp family transcriptional regulator n=1 Tax=Paenibacillus phyllosphaerae TaxID=274593 RepID=A0A7W5FPG0_9BACL|nr:Lrp/AsnC family transcriptional regulator [Paenibacillus phyllosphaerae]MBB3112197.1 DNA-binding Lrp family transcriptional regulator [Paenibacillus phyllosphaerae]
MDDLDKQILLALQDQGRLSMTDLGKAVSLSQPAVTERVRRLEEKGIIDHYRAVVAPDKINKPIAAFILFYTKGCDRFVEYCGQAPDVVELHRISGHQYNFLVKVVTESLQTLESAINELGAHGDSTTLIVLSSPIKQAKLIP